jgi:hypothetical protein
MISPSSVTRNPNPGSRVKQILDPGSAFASKNLSIFNPKKLFQSSQKYDPEPNLDFSTIPDPGSRGQKAPDPGSGSTGS